MWSFVCGAKGGSLPGLDELDAERRAVGMTVVAFCEQLGIPGPTWSRWRAAGSSVKGPWRGGVGGPAFAKRKP